MRYQFPVQVYYEDTDAGGVVYYANYLKFMERARTEWLRQLGFEQDDLIREHDILFAVRRAEIDYLRPARFNDRLLVTLEISGQGKASLSFAQDVVGESDGQTLCRGLIKIASIRASSFRPAPIPAAILEKIKDAE